MSRRSGFATRRDHQDRPLESWSDVELVRAHASGDQYAFATLFQRHKDHLWRTALRTSYSPEDAADALQDAMLSVHRTAGAFRADAAVRSWLHTIVVNACLDHIRRNKARPTTSLDAIPNPQLPDATDPMTAATSRLAIDQAILALPADQRAAVVAVDVHGYSVSAAAALLGVPEGTIKSRCARARGRLAVRLGFLRD